MSMTNLEEARRLAREAKEWLKTPEGQKAMEEAGRRAEETCKQLAESRKVGWRDLYEPFTI